MSIHEKIFTIEDKVYFLNNMIRRCDILIANFQVARGCLGKSYCNTIMKQIVNDLKTAASIALIDSEGLTKTVTPQCEGGYDVR